MIYKKSIVLSSVKGQKEKAVVTLNCNDNETMGTVRLYNFTTEPVGILSLGILSDGKVLKAGLIKDDQDLYTFKLSNGNNLNSFTCAIINFVGGEAKPLLLGGTNGTSENEERLCNSLCVFDGDATIEQTEKVLEENGVYIDDEEEIEDLIENEMYSCDGESKCSECRYRDAFFKLGDDSSMPEEKEETFFDGVKEQVEELFNKYPEDEILKHIIPESKWVKINYEDKNEYYVVGLLYEDNQIKYVCYGIPSIYKEDPPAEINGFCQWLPVDVNKEKGFGYWITYQDAQTGENVKMNFEII